MTEFTDAQCQPLSSKITPILNSGQGATNSPAAPRDQPMKTRHAAAQITVGHKDKIVNLGITLDMRISPKVTFARSAVAAALVVAGASAHAATDTASASAEVITPISITNTGDLAFGRFSANSGGGVVIATDGSRSTTGSVALYTGSTVSAASFDVAGLDGASYAITLPADGTITLSDGASATMAVDAFASNPSGTGVLTGGSQSIAVGATLTVASGQTPGVYTGSFDVTVEYN